MAQKSIKKNTVFNAIKTFSSIIFPLITFPYIFRVLQTENIGKINFGLSIVSYFTLIASLGIATYAIRECSAVREDKERFSSIASQIFSINVYTTIISYLALAFTLVFFKKIETYRELIIIQSLSIAATTLGADWVNSAMEDFKYITIRTLVFQVLSLALMFIFIHQPQDYMKYAVISLVSSAGASISNIWYRKKFCRISLILNVKTGIAWKEHMLPILYLFVMILAQTIFNSVDNTMLGLMHGDYEVGIYSAAHKILNIINQVIGSIVWVIMPRMSFYFAERNYNEVNRLLRKVLGFNFILGLPCAIGCCMIAEDLILVVAGESFIEAAPVLQILMIGFIFTLVGGNFLGNIVLLPSKQEKYYMIVCCITAVVNILGNYFFIPLFGARAAAGTTAMCSLLILVLLAFRADKNIKIQGFGKIVFAPMVGCIGIAGVCLLCRNITNTWPRVIISILGSIGIYGLIQIIFKNEFVEDAIQIVRHKMGRHE